MSILVLITSGARPELFCECIDSFRATCADLDLISEWLCIDDGTGEEWREKLKVLYPFITFVNKTREQVGHAKSLNMATNLIKESRARYIVRLEDDWKFVGDTPHHYLRDALCILESAPHLGQVMFNRNYQENVNDNLVGGIDAETPCGYKYLIHEYLPEEADRRAWYAKRGPCRSVLLSWPNFSLQPSLTRVAALLDVGTFRQDSSYFEYEYARRYSERGWITAFLPIVVCEHTGRRLGDFNGPLNAYELLGQEHFGKAPRPVMDHSRYRYEV